MRQLFYLLTTIILLAASCEKQDPNPAQFYIRCKIDGQVYLPNNCANCMTGQILGDTVFLLTANAGFEHVGVGIVKLDRVPIAATNYLLNASPQQSGVYDNSPQVNDIFKTDSTRTGQLIISSLDKANKIVAGTFYFKAYNPVQNKTVNITNGEFRIRYTDY